MEENHYIDKEVLFGELVKYNNARRSGNDVRVPEYIGKAILLICNGLALRPNFSGYTYIEDMKSDGIEDCLAAVKNFDPAKSVNGFGYFSRIAWWAFVQRIGIEKKQQYLKHKNYQNNYMFLDPGSVEDNTVERRERSLLSEQVIEDFERTLTKPKKESIKKETKNVQTKPIAPDPRDRKESSRIPIKGKRQSQSSIGKGTGRRRVRGNR